MTCFHMLMVSLYNDLVNVTTWIPDICSREIICLILSCWKWKVLCWLLLKKVNVAGKAQYIIYICQQCNYRKVVHYHIYMGGSNSILLCCRSGVSNSVFVVFILYFCVIWCTFQHQMIVTLHTKTMLIWKHIVTISVCWLAPLVYWMCRISHCSDGDSSQFMIHSSLFIYIILWVTYVQWVIYTHFQVCLFVFFPFFFFSLSHQ